MSVVQREQLDPRQDELGLYLWGTVVWFVLLFVGTALLIYAGHTILLE